MISYFLVTFDYSVRTLPFVNELSFYLVFGHQAHFPHNLISDLKFYGVHFFVEEVSCSVLIGSPCDMCFVSSFVQ